MAKLVLRCNYLRKAPPAHLTNFVKYIATRDGVDKIDQSIKLLPETVAQNNLIADITKTMTDTKKMHEYLDYISKPNRLNASEFITQVLEQNLDLLMKKKNYIDYLANRPGVEKYGTHGLFSNSGQPVILSQVMEEVSNHTGVLYTSVISLRREDAERLGYDEGKQWRENDGRSSLMFFLKDKPKQKGRSP